MSESQNIEWKSSWHDDYLKWICGFANAHGGTIYIGIDDGGAITGLSDAKKLMEELPNKIRNSLGVVCEVNLKSEEGSAFIEIITHPYSVPVSLRGRYYYRTGSTKIELSGNALNEFLLKKAGKTWDAVPEEGAFISDLDEGSIQTFLRAAEKSGRMPEVDGLSTEELLDKLRLLDGKKLKRAAIILFAIDPNRFYPNVKVKIGRFGKDDADLKFQEELEGNLIQLLRRVPEILNNKFLSKRIDFEGLQRIEKGEYPVAALREMLLNALVHRNYLGSLIQMRVYDDKITLWNEGLLPEGMTLESLKRTHSSRPRNPIIADVCFKAGYIDSWGRGTLKILNACKEAGLPEPEIGEMDGGIVVRLFKDKFTLEQLQKLGLNDRQLEVIEYLKEHRSITNALYQEVSNTSKATATRDIKDLEDKGILMNKGTKGASAVYVLIGS